MQVLPSLSRLPMRLTDDDYTRAPVRGCRGQLVLGGAPSIHTREKSVDLVLGAFRQSFVFKRKKVCPVYSQKQCSAKVSVTNLAKASIILLQDYRIITHTSSSFVAGVVMTSIFLHIFLVTPAGLRCLSFVAFLLPSHVLFFDILDMSSILIGRILMLLFVFCLYSGGAHLVAWPPCASAAAGARVQHRRHSSAPTHCWDLNKQATHFTGIQSRMPAQFCKCMTRAGSA